MFIQKLLIILSTDVAQMRQMENDSKLSVLVGPVCCAWQIRITPNNPKMSLTWQFWNEKTLVWEKKKRTGWFCVCLSSWMNKTSTVKSCSQIHQTTPRIYLLWWIRFRFLKLTSGHVSEKWVCGVSDHKSVTVHLWKAEGHIFPPSSKFHCNA